MIDSVTEKLIQQAVEKAAHEYQVALYIEGLNAFKTALQKFDKKMHSDFNRELAAPLKAVIPIFQQAPNTPCLLYTSDAADE